jgi:hypothetical protein
MKKALIAICLTGITGALVLTTPAQKKKTKKVVRPVPVASPSAAPTPAVPAPTPAKRNGRPGSESAAVDVGKVDRKTTPAFNPSYVYEFTRPGFTYTRILIEHEENGKGRISFLKDGYDELITDPLELSPVTIDRLNASLAALNFLDSTEQYQTEHDYSNMGNVTFTLRRGGRIRTVKYNWSDNKDAKAVMDEYRRIGNEYTWRFEIKLARENQPLQTPGIMDALASYLTRGEISDPHRLLPFLTELSNDERLPLIARNRAAKMAKEVEKLKK